MAEIFEDVFKTQAYLEPDVKERESFIQSSLNTIPYKSSELMESLTGASGEVPDSGKTQQTEAYTTVQATTKRTTVHHLGPGDYLELNSIRYQVVSIISGEGKTSEAVIYKVKNDASKIFALKLYYEFLDEHLEPNPDTLQRIREIGSKNRDILHLFDFGTGINKYQGKFCFEISDFAKGGDLLSVPVIREKYSTDFIKNTVVTSIINGILALHRDKIFHCDLKPQNVYFLDKEQTTVVIGDYGSAKSFEKSSEKELSHTTITKGTEFYLAPEQAFGIVSVKNDYYSLGMIVLHLLYPEKVTKANLRKIFERRTKGMPIIDFDPQFGRLNDLIEGLTLQDYNNRWGEEEVKNWLDGLDVNVNYGTSFNRKILNVANYTIKNTSELISYIQSESGCYEDLIENREAFSELLSWLEQLQGKENRLLFERMVAFYKKNFGIDYVREAVLSFLTPTREITIGQKVYHFNNLLKLTENISSFFVQLDSLWKISDFETLRFFFFQFEFAVRHLRAKAPHEITEIIDQSFKKISSIVGIDYQPDFYDLRAKLYLELKTEHFIKFFYAFNTTRGFRDINHNRLITLNEVSNFFVTHPQMQQNNLMQLEKLGFLHQVSLNEFCDYILQNDESGEFILKRDKDLDLLINLVAEFVKDRHPKEFVKEYVLKYREEEEFIFKEAINRMLKPDQPVIISFYEINFYRKGDFNNKVRDFFEKIDIVWKTSDFKELVLHFFSFEMSLLLISRQDKIAYKSMVKPIFEKIGATLKTPSGNMNTLQCQFYKMIGPENIIELLYQFIPNRPFRYQKQELRTVEELGFFYLKNPDLFVERFSQIERETFFRNHSFKSFSNLTYEDFILRVFRSKATIETEITNIQLDEPAVGEITIWYQPHISLNDYLANQGYTSAFTSKSADPKLVVVKGGEFVNAQILFERFTAAVLSKNRISDNKLAGSSKENFLQSINQKIKLEQRNSIHYIPDYVLFLFPIFGLLFFYIEYLVDYSMIKSFFYGLAPTLNLVFVRVAKSHYPVLLFTAYFINFVVGIFMLAPIYSLYKQKEPFNKFFQFYSTLINKTIMYFVFAPAIFVGIIIFAEYAYAGGNQYSRQNIQGFHPEEIGILIYVVFMANQVFKIVVAFFRSFKKFRFVPFAISIGIYLLAGLIFLSYKYLYTPGNKRIAFINSKTEVTIATSVEKVTASPFEYSISKL